MDDADEIRFAALELMLRNQMDRNKILWEQKARAQFNSDNWEWLVTVWWPQRKPEILSAYAAAELGVAVAALRAGKDPPPPRRARFEEWKPGD